MRRLLFFLLLIPLSSPCFSSCACDSVPVDPAAAFASSHVVFEGEVIGIATNWVSGGWKVTFQVNRSWKRQVEQVFTAGTEDVANCGVAFALGKSYRVFVKRKFAFTTSRCDGTVPLENANTDTDVFGEAFTPGLSRSVRNTMWGMGVLVAAGLLGMLFIVLRKRTKPPRG